MSNRVRSVKVTPRETNENHINPASAKQTRKKTGCCYTARMQTSLDDIRTAMFWKAVFAELLGTFILCLISLGSTVQGWEADTPDVVQIALAFGFSVASAVWIVGHISGGHINPAVTIAMFATRRVSLFRAIMFMIAQCGGAIGAAGVLRGCTPSAQHASLGATTLNTGVTTGMGVVVELCITFFLVLTVFASCDTKRADLSGSFPLAIGLSVAMGHLWAVEVTGSSMNPARSLGPAVVMGVWDDHWVYWVGPMSGGLAAGLIYDNILASNSSLTKLRGFLMSAEFDDDNYPATKAKLKLLDDDNDAEYSTHAV